MKKDKLSAGAERQRAYRARQRADNKRRQVQYFLTDEERAALDAELERLRPESIDGK